MRFLGLLAAAVLLAGCGQSDSINSPNSGFSKNSSPTVFAGDTIGFDYRYAYRLPSNRLKGVLRSNADACEQLGPARCKIQAMRYQVDGSNHSKAVLTLLIDPALARKYGDAVGANVSSADGVLVDTEITGSDTTAAARSIAVVNRLQDQLRNVQSSGAADSDGRVARLKNALATITEVEASQGQSLATVPMLITYESSNALSGLGSSDANLRAAKEVLGTSSAQLLTVLAGVGPWLLLMLVVVLILRWIIHGRAGAAAAPIHASNEYGGNEFPHEQDAYQTAPPPRERGSLLHRWFAKDE